MDRTDKDIYNNLKYNFKVWISTKNDEGIIGDGKWQILKAIDRLGSLRAATNELGITYRRTWNDFKKIEEYLGFPLIEKARGGKNGGNTTLTREGRTLVKAFDKLHSSIDGHIEKAFREFSKELKK